MAKLKCSFGAVVGAVLASACLAFLPVAAQAVGDGLTPPRLGAPTSTNSAQQFHLVWIPVVIGGAPAAAAPGPMVFPGGGYSGYPFGFGGLPTGPGPVIVPGGGSFFGYPVSFGALPTGPGPVIIPGGGGSFGFPYATGPGPVILPGRW